MNDQPKPKRGRPPLPESERANSYVMLRVTQRRKSAYKRAANGATLAGWAIAKLDQAAEYKP
jgi:hypothetical protein